MEFLDLAVSEIAYGNDNKLQRVKDNYFINVLCLWVDHYCRQ